MKKRVLIIIPSLGRGGAERVAADLSVGLPADWQVDLLLREDKIDYRCRADGKKYVTGTGVFGIWKQFLLLRRLKRKNAYDIYNSHMASCNILNLFSGAKSGKCLLTIHNLTSRQMKDVRCGWLVNGIIRRFYGRAEGIIAVSSTVKADLCAFYGLPEGKTAVIENGVDVAYIQEMREQALSEQEEGLFDTHPVLATMGRYAPAKAHIKLFDAFAVVLEQYPNARLLLIGEGELRKTYEAELAKRGWQGSVILTGYRTNPFQLLRHSDAYVFSSVFEGCCCAQTEASFCGIPGIVVNCPGLVTGMLDHPDECTKPLRLQSGMLSPAIDTPGAPQLLGEALCELLGAPEYGRQCVAYNETQAARFSVENMVKKWKKQMETL